MHLSGNNSTRLCLHHDSRPLDPNDCSRGLRLHRFSLLWTFFLFLFFFGLCGLSTSVVGGMSLGTPPLSLKASFPLAYGMAVRRPALKPLDAPRRKLSQRPIKKMPQAALAIRIAPCMATEGHRSRIVSRSWFPPSQADSLSIFDADDASD